MLEFALPSHVRATADSERSQARVRRHFEAKKLIRYLLILIPIGMAGNLTFFYLQSGRKMFSSVVAFSPSYLILTAILSLVPWLTTTIRTQLWTRFLGEKHSFRDILPISIGCDLGSAITPTALGGGYVKLAMLVEKGMSPGKAASLMTLMTVEDFFFFLAAIPAALIFSPSAHSLVDKSFSFRFQSWKHYLPTGLTALLLLAVLGLYFKKRFHLECRKLPLVARISAKIRVARADFLGVYQLIGRKGKKILLLNILLAAVQWSCRYSVITTLLASFHVPVKPVDFFLLQWIVSTVGAVTPTPGGAAGVEAAFYFFYHQFVPSELIGPTTIAWRFFSFYFQISLGTLFFILIYGIRKPRGILPRKTPQTSLFCSPQG